ncbi:disulfide bond formation protein B [Sandarakinorhabdus oryzae]|uniref:disulfide bond formation protein B n=1 Tax=Sandarakinorhabdus oryzae TaxID=2675220 RepID=UPI0012E1922D|nr:disulfide bond formation protein B [Sandarakinorhabdus oryzae]
MRSEVQAPALVLAGSLALLGGAYAFEILGGLVPCEMCWWQRYALMATAFFAADALLLAGVARRQPAITPVVKVTAWVAILALASNAGIALFHAGVEYKWWQGLTRCTAPLVAGDAKSMMADILAQPLVRCDAIPWQMFGISMAGWNFVVSLLLVGAATWLMLKPR